MTCGRERPRKETDTMSEQQQIKLFINNADQRHFARETTVREVIAAVLDGDEGFLFVGEADEPAGLDIIIAEIITEKHGRIHVSHCHRVTVKVEYSGQDRTEHVKPSTRIKTILERATAENWLPAPIDPMERPKFALFVPGSLEPLDDSRHIGTCLQKGDCAITLELSLRVRPQG